MIDALAPTVAEEAEPRAADDRALLKNLARSCRGGRVTIEADLHRLRHIHSPVLSQADGNQWMIGSLAILGALTVLIGLYFHRRAYKPLYDARYPHAHPGGDGRQP